MCGITAYAGKESALPFLLQGLEKLEYRGYDSAGVTLVSNHHLETYKAKGRLTNLKELLNEKEHPEHTGIGHTRWATHGVPSNMNSHPHTNESETISIVHNGIIENYASIKECLLEQGYTFQSQTDSEVIVHMLDYYYQGDMMYALKKCVQYLQGSFALCVVCTDYPDCVFVAKKESPMILGKTDTSAFCASDIPAVLDYTKDISVDDFPGVGRAISKKLADYRVKTLGELRARPNLLYLYGKTGVELYERICGTDNERVIPYSDRRGIGISRNFKAIIDRNEIYRRVMILARYLSYTITKLNLNPTTFYFKIRYEYGIKNSQSITENRLFNEKFLIDLSKSMIKKLDNRLNYKIHYIAISASNFANSYSNLKTFSVIDYKKDLKYKALNENLLKVRDKYGVDIIRYASEELNG